MSKGRSRLVHSLTLSMLGGLAGSVLASAGCEPPAPLTEAADETPLALDDVTAQSARPPTLTKIEPATVITGTELELTITGKGFVPGARVTVSGTPAPEPRSVTSTRIVVALPLGVAPTTGAAVRVTLPDGRTSERSDLFAVTVDPLVLSQAQPWQRLPLAAPRSPVVADFNRDGQPDIAVVSSLTSGVVVQLGSGTGVGRQVVGPTLAQLYNLFAADLNGDGKLDLVATTRSSASLSVLLGNGDGSFQAPLPVTAKASFSDYQHNHVAIGDLTSDGKLDLLVGDVSGDLILLPGNGDGTFAAGLVLASTSYPVRSLQITDLDGGGGLDIVATTGYIGTSPTSGKILTLLRQPDGTFKSNSMDVTETYSASVASDVNGDGKADLTVLSGSGAIKFLRGGGDGTLTEVAATTGIPVNGSFLLATELNGDGKTDFVSGGQFDTFTAAGATYTGLGKGDGTLRTTKLETAAGHSGGAVADMNKDGRPDLVLTSSVDNAIYVVFGRGDGSFVTNLALGASTAAATADFNGDGKADLAFVDSGSSKLSIALGGGDGAFSAPRTFDVDKAPSAIATGDWNGDGKVDALVSCYDTSVVSLLLGNGDGTFAPQRTFTVGKGPNAVAAVDLDGNGQLDVVTANTDADTVSVLIGNGTGNFATSRNYATGKAPVALAIGDLNADGRPDVVTANADGNNVGYLQGSAVTAGVLNAFKTVAAGTAPSGIVLSDLTGDGKLDIVVVNSDSNNITTMAGRGDGTFATARVSATCEFPTSIAVSELTGDNKPDAVVQCAGSRRSQVLIGLGDGGFVPSPQALAQGSALVVSDVNGDSKSDILLLTSNALLQVLLNIRG